MTKSGEIPLLPDMFPELRKGKWTKEKLHCDPMRITKKFSGNDCIGKQVFSGSAPIHDDKTIKRCEAELKKLERIFILRLVNKSKEQSRSASQQISAENKRKLAASKRSLVAGKKIVAAPNEDIGYFATSVAPTSHSSPSLSSTSLVPPATSASDMFMPPHVNLPTSTSSCSIISLSSAAEVHKRKGKGVYKRVSSAPDLISLEQFERAAGVGGALLATAAEGHARKKRRLDDTAAAAAAAAIPRSRSTQSFDSFAEIDDRAAGELLLSFSETLRNNFLALQQQTSSSAALPAFFSHEATSSEAAKFTKSRGRGGGGGGGGGNISSRNLSASARFLHSLSLLQSASTAASLFPEMSSQTGANNDFSVLEERVPFSGPSDSSDSAAWGGHSIFESMTVLDAFRSLSPGGDPGATDDIFEEEPEFFIGSGTDIE